MPKQGLVTLVAKYLHATLYKTKSIQCSNWGASRLTPKQIEYAALDAWAVRKVFIAMVKEYCANNDVSIDEYGYVGVAELCNAMARPRSEGAYAALGALPKTEQLSLDLDYIAHLDNITVGTCRKGCSHDVVLSPNFNGVQFLRDMKFNVESIRKQALRTDQSGTVYAVDLHNEGRVFTGTEPIIKYASRYVHLALIHQLPEHSDALRQVASGQYKFTFPAPIIPDVPQVSVKQQAFDALMSVSTVFDWSRWCQLAHRVFNKHSTTPVAQSVYDIELKHSRSSCGHWKAVATVKPRLLLEFLLQGGSPDVLEALPESVEVSTSVEHGSRYASTVEACMGAVRYLQRTAATLATTPEVYTL